MMLLEDSVPTVFSQHIFGLILVIGEEYKKMENVLQPPYSFKVGFEVIYLTCYSSSPLKPE